MKKIIVGLMMMFALATGAPAFADEGPVASNDNLRARLSSSGWITIYGIPNSADCYGNKIEVPNSQEPEMKQMVVSLITAAQLAGRQINFWYTRYDSTNPQRCELRYIEMNHQ